MSVDRSSAAPPAPDRSHLAGITLAVSGVLCFACMDTCAKWLNRTLPPAETVAIRYLGSFFFVLLLVKPWQKPAVMRTHRLGLQCARSCCLVLGTLCSFTALRYLPLTQVTSITFSAPLIVALLAGPLLGERIGPRRAVAVCVGFAGVLVATRPTPGGLHPAALLCLGNAITSAFYYIFTRRLAAHDQPETTLFYTSFVGSLVCLPMLPFVWVMPATWGAWLALLVLGALGALAHWLLILAHKRTPASVLAPFFYAQLIGAAGLAWLAFGEIPTGWTILGGSIVLSSGLYLVYRERVRQKFPSSDVAL
ncbi:DMT family transporter [Opitutus terrae]|uniref:EamA domain-containing protein n=1 Tax=Opitutus terrae (strain DSM 11246 / JCM 15787 / PB90-1) TaxID=452637 RepID=B1ZXJ3_OPITP|nr:DMT family transporter [Opitutus terrae]ACB76988.1 protein of unknown function DUF6 transmembrane [Opitutus terrae PB90-1]